MASGEGEWLHDIPGISCVNRGNFDEIYQLSEDALACGNFSVVHEVTEVLGRSSTVISEMAVPAAGLVAKIIEKGQGSFYNLVNPSPAELCQREHTLTAHNTTSGSQHCVKLFDVFENETEIIFVFERLQHDLLEYFANRPFTEKDVASVIHDILLALTEAASANPGNPFLHRDIKPTNIMVNEEDGQITAKLIDFGLSRSAAGTHTMAVGTFHFWAPELLRGAVAAGNEVLFPNGIHGHKSDIWGLGIVAFILLLGIDPFSSTIGETEPHKWADALTELSHKLRDGEKHHLSQRACDFLQQALEPDAAQRREAADLLTHEWISGADNQTEIPLFVREMLRQMSPPRE